MEITDEQKKRWRENKESWFQRAEKEIYTTNDCENFINELTEYCSSLKDGTDIYQETADASGAISYAALNMCAHMFGLSGLQVGYIMWDLIDKLVVSEHDCGMRLVNYRDMLYPQYESEFEKTINKSTWEALQSNAKKLIEESEKSDFPAHQNVVAHWKSIVDGKVPFGYKVV